LLAEGRLRHVQPIGSVGKIQLLGSSDKIFKVAKFHYRLRSIRPRWAIDSSGFVESTGAQKDPFKEHTFAITESNGNASKRVLGNFLNRGDLALSDKLLFAQ